jgi:DNA-directed RNA polymerase subunit RPC12/RpoP
MVRHNIRMVVAFSAFTVLAAWLALMVSFWLPGVAGHALQATALSLGIPGLVVAVVGVIFESELTEEFELRGQKAKAHALRCTDCGSKILNAGGTTIGDQIEGEVMMLRPQHAAERQQERKDES